MEAACANLQNGSRFSFAPLRLPARDGCRSCIKLRFSHPRPCRSGFTLIELLVSMSVLVLLMALIAQLFSSASTVTGLGNKHMDADSQAQAVFNRMAIDFSQIVKRPDVDYYLKSSTNDPYGNNQLQPGNDQLAFYSQVPGYLNATGTTTTNSQTLVSLVGYRVNSKNSSASYNKLERYGYGLAWNGVSSSYSQVMFSTASISGIPYAVTTDTFNNAIYQNWRPATDATTTDANNYELIGPQVFRMEYYYVLRGQTVGGTNYPSILSDTPWYDPSLNSGAGIPNHASVNGLQDVAAITVVIAVIDAKSKVLVTDAQLTSLAGKLVDFSPTLAPLQNGLTQPGNLEASWQTAIDNSPTTLQIPRVAAEAIRVYSRTFYLSGNSTPNP
ncbi:MAG: prepilin-type N-terminal cleavage/methylation domain-containing protein [Methylacidiphilales bacterium]|nr:prepilin-type N-terminal cleavage/methylation domain-containing protein [Candidatus Methylacidiphilales bacterium]